MANLTAKIYNQDGTEAGEQKLEPKVFGVKANAALIHEIVVAQESNARETIANTKTRADVSGAGRKLWKQKGTGRARIGSVRSPLWRHGGIVHGPHPRTYDLKINKKERQEALRVALSEKLRGEGLWVMDSLILDAPKTKELAAKLKDLGLEKRVLLVDGKENGGIKRASRNLQRVACASLDSLNAYHVLKAGAVLLSREAVAHLTEVLAR